MPSTGEGAPKRRKRKIRGMRLLEISSVKRGAQGLGIGEVLMKRKPDEIETATTSATDNARPQTVTIDGQTYELTLVGGQDTATAESPADSAAETNTAESSAEGGDMTDKQDKGESAAVAADLAKAQTERDEALTRAARAEAIVKLSPRERAHFDALGKDEQSKFLKADEATRAAELAKADDANPIVHEGASGVFRKSDDARLVEMAKRADAMAADLEKSTQRLEKAAFEKRADEEFGHLVGKVEDRGLLLALVEKHAPEDRRDNLYAILKANAAGLENATKTLGVNSPADEGGTTSKIDALAKALRDADPTLTAEQAFSQAASSPEGRKMQLLELEN